MSNKLTARVNEIVRNEEQPRTYFDKAALEALAGSLRKKQRQPITVVPFRDPARPEARWKIVDGERRWRAAQMADLAKVWIVVEDEVTNDAELHSASFEANWNRAGHTHAETAMGIDRELRSGKTVEQVAAMVGKSTTWVNKEHSLLKLHPDLLAQMDAPTPPSERLRTAIAYTLVQWPADKQLRLYKRFQGRPSTEVFHHLRASAPTQATGRRPSDDAVYILGRVRAAMTTLTSIMSLPESMLSRLTAEQRRKIAERLREGSAKALEAAAMLTAGAEAEADDEE